MQETGFKPVLAKNYYIVRNLSMANFLVRSGHDIFKVDDSEVDYRMKVFLFKDSADLREQMTKFKREKRRK